jgi:hypothetical protein
LGELLKDYTSTGTLNGDNTHSRSVTTSHSPAVLPEPPAASAPKPVSHARTGKTSKLGLAMAILFDHPDWTVEEIAKHVPCNPKYLSQVKRFRDARKAIKAMGKQERNRSPYHGRDLDAYPAN